MKIHANDNSDNKHKLKNSDVLVAGTCGGVSSVGFAKILNSSSNNVYNSMKKHAPMMFSEEKEYFQTFINYMENICKDENSDTDLKNILEKLKNTGESKKELIQTAYEIFDSPIIRDSRNYLVEFLNLSKASQKLNFSDKLLIASCENLLKDKKLYPNERALLEMIKENPTKRKDLPSIKKLESISVNRRITNFAQDVIINPKLVKLANQILIEEGLQDKGIRHVFGTPRYYSDLKNITLNKIKTNLEQNLEKIKIEENDSFIQKTLKKIKIIKIKRESARASKAWTKKYNSWINGTNATYLPKSKFAYLPIMTRSKEAFAHELGHGAIYTINKNLAEFLLFSRGKLQKYVLIPTVISSLFLKKSDDENKNGKIKKFRNFLKNNIGTIALAVSAPKLLDEGLASVKAINFLKNRVTPKQLMNQKINLLLSFSTYLSGAVILASALKFGVWVSDKIQEAKQKS